MATLTIKMTLENDTYAVFGVGSRGFSNDFAKNK